MTHEPTAEQVHDAGIVLRHTTYCHRRTSPKFANENDARATAIVWAKLFARYDFPQQLLIDAVERRAESEAQSPEPAEIIAAARALRRERSEREKAPTVTTDTKQLSPTRRAISGCRDCDPNGWLETPTGKLMRCTHGRELGTGRDQ